MPLKQDKDLEPTRTRQTDSQSVSFVARRREMGETLKAELETLRGMQPVAGVETTKQAFQQTHANCLHEASHAVLAAALGRTLKRITVVRDEGGDGSVVRTKRDDTPHGIIEEILIASAGCLGADALYGFSTPGNYDDQKILELNQKLPTVLLRIAPEDMRQVVAVALRRLHSAVEDLAVALAIKGTLSGLDAEELLREHLSGEAADHTKQELQDQISLMAKRKKPVCVVGWGEDGCQDVDEVVNFYGYDEGLYCVRAESSVDSREVLETIERWLAGNKNAQTLHIGMHGTEDALYPEETYRGAKISYKEVAGTIKRNFCGDAGALSVFLGACKSEHAAALWNQYAELPICLLVAFHGDEEVEVVREVLGKFLESGDILMPGRQVEFKDIAYLDEVVEDLQGRYSNVKVFHRLDSEPQLREVHKSENDVLRERLEKRGQIDNDGLLADALSSIALTGTQNAMEQGHRTRERRGAEMLKEKKKTPAAKKKRK